MTQRRRRRRTSPPPPTFQALAEADGAEVDDLLREVSQFRLALDTDLTIAAAAADAAADFDAPQELSDELTAQAVDAGRSALDELVTRRRLDVGGTRPRRATTARRAGGNAMTRGRRPRGRRLRGVPMIGVGPLVGVAVVLGIGTGFFASHVRGSHSQGFTTVAATSLDSLSSALGNGDDQAAREAGNQLSAAIGSLIAAAPGDPAAAQAAATALTAEQTVLATAGGSLGAQLRASMTAQVAALQATVHSPISTLVTPTGTASRPVKLPIPVTLPSSLPSALKPVAALPSLLARATASHHAPDPVSSIVSLVLPSASPSAPVFKAPSPAAPTASVAPTAAGASPTATASGSASPAATPSASSSGPANPLPFSTDSAGGFIHP